MRRAMSLLAALMVMVALMTSIAVPAMAARGEGRHEARIDKRLGLTEGSLADLRQDRGRFFGNCGFNSGFNCFNGACFNNGLNCFNGACFNNGFGTGFSCFNGACFNNGFNNGFNCGFNNVASQALFGF